MIEKNNSAMTCCGRGITHQEIKEVGLTLPDPAEPGNDHGASATCIPSGDMIGPCRG